MTASTKKSSTVHTATRRAESRYGIPAVVGTLHALEYLCRAGRPVSLGELCDAAGKSTATGYRMIKSLLAQGWLQQSAGRKYVLAVDKLRLLLGALSPRPWLKNAQSLLDALAVETGLSCKLSVREDAEQVVMLRAEAPAAITISGKVGARFPVIEGSVGAALLAETSAEEVRALIDDCRETIAETRCPQVVSDRIARIRAEGFVVNCHSRWRVTALSTPVYENENQIAAALTLVGFNEEITAANAPQLAAVVKKSAGRIEALIKG